MKARLADRFWRQPDGRACPGAWDRVDPRLAIPVTGWMELGPET
jgi:hypothetical protein